MTGFITGTDLLIDGGEMRRMIQMAMLMLLMIGGASVVRGVEVILTGGVALKSWEHLRGPAKHDNWWANFVRASTVQIVLSRRDNPSTSIVWIVFRPSYITRSKEEGKDVVSAIRQTAAKYGVKLRFVDTSAQAYNAINSAAVGGDRITAFYYFGHSNAHAFMLDYSNSIIGASKQWIHERELSARLRRDIFASHARCISYGCYTGLSMSSYWKKATGVPLRGNTQSTRYQPVGKGLLPIGTGRWVE